MNSDSGERDRDGIPGWQEAAIVRALEEDIIFGRLRRDAAGRGRAAGRFPVTRHFIRQALYSWSGWASSPASATRRHGAVADAGRGAPDLRVRELLQRQAALAIPSAPAEMIGRLLASDGI